MDENELALQKLQALVQIPGALKHVTNEHNCGIPAGRHTPIGEDEEAVCAAAVDANNEPVPLTDHRHFVVHAVTRIEGPDANGRYTAHTDEGDWRTGSPVALLKRLTEVG